MLCRHRAARCSSLAQQHRAFCTRYACSLNQSLTRGTKLILRKAIIHENEVIVQRQNLNFSNTESFLSNDSINLNGKFQPQKGIAYQSHAPDDLKVVSWAPGKSVKDLNYYTYDLAGGQNVVVYLVEEGIDPQNSVSNFFWRVSTLI